ncbi:hypothetical protein ACFY36_38030 [Actinoplanes sp. NPDC000266]
MSFGTYERKVRDPSLAHGQRFNALVGCVERYGPIGFHATFGYLEHVAGPLRRDEAALLRAMDALSSSRALWLIQSARYAEQRRAAKRLGRRTPPAREPDTCSPWYGDERNAALYALEFLLAPTERRRREPTVDAAVLQLASALLERGHLRAAEIDRARLLRDEFRRLRQSSGWPDVDWPNWHRANDSLRVLRLIEHAEAGDRLTVSR